MDENVDIFDSVITNISENGEFLFDNKINEEKVTESIEKQFKNNRVITGGFNHMVLESILDDLEGYTKNYEE